MRIDTKYNMFDKVWLIQSQKKKTWIECSFCGGKGHIYGQDNSNRECPKCYGRCGKHEYGENHWQVIQSLTIGMIRAEIIGEDPIGTPGHEEFSNYGPQKYRYTEEYMCKETGIRSGSVYKVGLLWPSKEEAQKECDRRNKT